MAITISITVSDTQHLSKPPLRILTGPPITHGNPKEVANPVQVALGSHAVHDQSRRGDQCCRQHHTESHLRLSDISVTLGQVSCKAIECEQQGNGQRVSDDIAQANEARVLLGPVVRRHGDQHGECVIEGQSPQSNVDAICTDHPQHRRHQEIRKGTNRRPEKLNLVIDRAPEGDSLPKAPSRRDGHMADFDMLGVTL